MSGTCPLTYVEEAIQMQDQDAIEKKSKAAESDKRQLDDFKRKYDDLMNWINSQY